MDNLFLPNFITTNKNDIILESILNLKEYEEYYVSDTLKDEIIDHFIHINNEFKH